MRRRSFLLIHTLVVLALLSACERQATAVDFPAHPRINSPEALPGSLNAFPTLSARNPDIQEDYQPVAENAILRLYVRKASSAIIVEDLRSGRLWRSSPVDLADNKGTTTAWRRQIEFPVQVAFTDPDRSQAKNGKVDREAELRFRPVHDGVQVHYDITNIQIAFDAVFALKDDCMVATLPEASIQETGGNGLVSVDFLPFFGATHDGEEGYIVYPDGAGALMRFNTPHPEEVQKINTVIYGTDASGGFFGSQDLYREQVPMPVFGLVSAPEKSSAEDLSGYVALITNGDFDANIGVARSGKGLNYNHVWTTFLYRRQGRFSLTGGQPAWLYQPDRIQGDRTVRYCFLNGADASYVSMGTRYRDFLIQERDAQRVGSRATGAGEAELQAASLPRLTLGFFMGIERRNWFLADMISMTTFDQAQAILKDLDRAGVRSVDIQLSNWNYGGTASRYPQRLPVDKRLGGERGLRALAEDTQQRGQRLFLQDGYIGVPPNARGFTPYLDAARGVDGLPVGGSDVGYLINPQVALRSYAARDLPVMATFGANGVSLDGFASLTIPDKNQRYPLSREEFAATYMQIGQLARRLFGSVAMSGANIYTVPYVDRLENVSLDSTHYDLFDQPIPLYPIAVHGLVLYTNMPYNLVSDGQRMLLHQVEYGAQPSFIITEQNSAQLLRTEANGIFSSQYSFWRDEIIRQYQVMEKLEGITTQFITGHAQLADQVFQTTYEDGTRVIVNYGGQAYPSGSISVPAHDFVVVRGE